MDSNFELSVKQARSSHVALVGVVCQSDENKAKAETVAGTEHRTFHEPQAPKTQGLHSPGSSASLQHYY